MENRWSAEDVNNLDELDLLVYQSRLIGEEPSLVLWGGGNTSLKVTRSDFRGRQVKAMLAKGSGSDMKAALRRDFPALRMDDILPLFELTEMSDDGMVDYLSHCVMDPGSPRPSIETLLHGFLPQNSVVHTHADAILSLTNTCNPHKVLAQVFGSDVIVVDYHRPGFLLSKEVAAAVLKRPGARGLVLLNHGLITWGSTPQISYQSHVELISEVEQFLKARASAKVPFGGVKTPALDEAERCRVAGIVTPVLRSLLSPSPKNRVLVRFEDSADVLEFACSKKADAFVEAGAATPDHMLSTKRNPLLVEVSDPSYAGDVRRSLESGVEEYRRTYTDWFNRHKNGLVEMRDPNPRVVLAPGLGMWVAGKDTRGLNTVSDIYHHTISIMAGAHSVDGYVSLPPKEAYDVEYWPLELYKLSLQPPEQELTRRIALVTGAASGIGKAIAFRLAQEGAHVSLVDIDADGVGEAAQEINAEVGENRCIGVTADVTDQEQVAGAFQRTVLAFGGLDILVSNAGIAPTGTLDELDLSNWQRSLDVNATAHLLVSQEAVRIMRAQGMGGSLIFVVTKNVTAPGAGFGAYSAAKAAEAQLARVLAIENGRYGIRSNIINPDSVFQDSRLWSEELREQRAAAHGVAVSELEGFYSRRNLLQEFITPRDVAEAALYLASDRSAKTTGCMITVDGGLVEAFPR